MIKRKLNPKSKLFSYPKSKKPFNKENLREWILENWTLFEEEDGEINPDIFEASFNAFGKKMSLSGKTHIEQNRWINEIFNELDEIRKSEKYFDLRKGKYIQNPSKKKVSKKKSSKKLTKKVTKKKTGKSSWNNEMTKKQKLEHFRALARANKWEITGQNAAGGFGAGFGIGAGNSFADWLFN